MKFAEEGYGRPGKVVLVCARCLDTYSIGAAYSYDGTRVTIPACEACILKDRIQHRSLVFAEAMTFFLDSSRAQFADFVVRLEKRFEAAIHHTTKEKDT